LNSVLLFFENAERLKKAFGRLLANDGLLGSAGLMTAFGFHRLDGSIPSKDKDEVTNDSLIDFG
jgi:hypothetical protein